MEVRFDVVFAVEMRDFLCKRCLSERVENGFTKDISQTWAKFLGGQKLRIQIIWRTQEKLPVARQLGQGMVS